MTARDMIERGMDQLESQIERLQDLLNDANREISRLNTALDDAQSEIETLEADLTERT